MGLPIQSLAIATNENDILARFWNSGKYEKVSSELTPAGEAGPANGGSDGKQQEGGGVKETLSPAMDILVSSNFERLLWYLAYEISGNNRAKACEMLNGWMTKVKSDGKVQVPGEVLEAARRDFVAERISDEEVLDPFQLAGLTLITFHRHYNASKTRTKNLTTSQILTQPSALQLPRSSAQTVTKMLPVSWNGKPPSHVTL